MAKVIFILIIICIIIGVVAKVYDEIQIRKDFREQYYRKEREIAEATASIPINQRYCGRFCIYAERYYDSRTIDGKHHVIAECSYLKEQVNSQDHIGCEYYKTAISIDGLKNM